MDHTSADDAANEALLAKQAARESSARTYPRELPIAIDEAAGIEVVDMDGNRYYDCLAGAGTLALGHNHPAVIEAMEELLDRGRALHTLDITTPAKERFVDALFDSLPDEFTDTARVHFCSPAGTDAIEAAAKLAKTATNRETLLAFQGSYHGMTHGSLGLTGDRSAKADVPGLVPNVHFLPYPYDYRPPFGLGGEDGGSRLPSGATCRRPAYSPFRSLYWAQTRRRPSSKSISGSQPVASCIFVASAIVSWTNMSSSIGFVTCSGSMSVPSSSFNIATTVFAE
jgi:4-aminobutyrate aminotransferase-like enzyme